MPAKKNIILELIILVLYLIPFFVLSHQLFFNIIDGHIEFVDFMIILFIISLSVMIYFQYLTIRLNIRFIRNKPNDMTINK